MNINELKIQICLECDAASFTLFFKDKQSDNEIENSYELKTSQIGRMNDQYPIQLFQFVNTLKEYIYNIMHHNYIY